MDNIIIIINGSHEKVHRIFVDSRKRHLYALYVNILKASWDGSLTPILPLYKGVTKLP